MAIGYVLTTVHVGRVADTGGVALDPVAALVYTVAPGQHRGGRR